MPEIFILLNVSIFPHYWLVCIYINKEYKFGIAIIIAKIRKCILIKMRNLMMTQLDKSCFTIATDNINYYIIR